MGVMIQVREYQSFENLPGSVGQYKVCWLVLSNSDNKDREILTGSYVVNSVFEFQFDFFFFSLVISFFKHSENFNL